ncbi:MAG: hypothetical protein ACRYG8_37100 [Janthinobacterium lividum]
MKVDIYQSKSRSDHFLTVPAGTKLDAIELPVALATVFASVSMFKAGIEMEADKPRAAMKPKEILADIERQGFAVHQGGVTVTVGSRPSGR